MVSSSTSRRSPPERGPIRVFLSHRYGSPRVNLRFYELFSRAAQVQFSVDPGDLDTNVTRLERMVREADAFIGLYPLGIPATQEVTPEEARKQSRYFRLELDLAIRSGLPAIVFADERYGNLLDCPSWIFQHTFDIQEIEAPGDGRQLQVYAQAFQAFCRTVTAYQGYRVHRALQAGRRSTYALLLPPQLYGADLRKRLTEVLQESGRDVIDLGWPPRLGTKFHRRLGDVDVVVLDLSQSSESAVIASFLHGHFVPAIRLSHREATGTPGAMALNHPMFADFEVGYAKDIVEWVTEDQLLLALRTRLKTLLVPQRLIGDTSEALAYFHSASLRKEIIFVSYAGADAALAAPVIAALKKTFKTVFDYKDGESIVPGRPWLEEIFGSIARSAAAAILLSPRYLASGNCLHEARQIVARRDEGRLAVLPLRLSDERIDTPDYLQDTQHARLPQLTGPEEVPRLLAQLLSPSPPAGRAPTLG